MNWNIAWDIIHLVTQDMQTLHWVRCFVCIGLRVSLRLNLYLSSPSRSGWDTSTLQGHYAALNWLVLIKCHAHAKSTIQCSQPVPTPRLYDLECIMLNTGQPCLPGTAVHHHRWISQLGCLKDSNAHSFDSDKFTECFIYLRVPILSLTFFLQVVSNRKNSLLVCINFMHDHTSMARCDKEWWQKST